MARLGDMLYRFVLSHECPYLKIEIWGTRLWPPLDVGHPPLLGIRAAGPIPPNLLVLRFYLRRKAERLHLPYGCVRGASFHVLKF